MAKGHEVIITVDEQAEVKVEVKGLKGTACKLATVSLEKLGQVISDEPTREMHERELQTETRHRNRA